MSRRAWNFGATGREKIRRFGSMSSVSDDPVLRASRSVQIVLEFPHV